MRQPHEKSAMRVLLLLAILLLAALPLQAQTFLYVSMAPEQKIQIYRLDPNDGKLSAVDTVAVEGTPGSLGVDPQKKLLFASLRSTSTLASFGLDQATGKLKLLSTAPLGKDENAAFVGTDRTGRWLLSASYMAGKIVVHRLGDDGAIKSPAVQVVETAKTAHSTLIDRGNRFVFVPHVAPNAVYQFRFDPKSGQLTDAGKVAGGAPKAGPRHLAFHPKLDLAFTSDEEGSSITAYRFDKEKGLTAYQTLSTLPADFSGKNTTAEVKVHPSGKFVWVSNRGHDSLAGFAIDAKNGALTALGQTPTEKTPRSFEIDPDGKYLFAAGEGSGKLAVYRIDAQTGKLTPAHTVDVGKSLTWVLAVKQEGKKPAPKKTTFTDAKEAGVDFVLQGEYAAERAKLGCQVIALGNGAFQAVVLPGGLPGEGWDGAAKILMDGKLNGARVEFTPTAGKRKYMAGNPLEFSATALFPPKGHKDYTGALTSGTLTLTTDDGRTVALTKVTRQSPTLNAKPLEGALVLFDGTNASEWKEGKIVDGLLPVEANTKRKFKDFKLHLEFRTPFQPTARDQGRGNSGVYLHGQQEIQVLDSFGLEGKNNECGGFYGRKEPKVNMCYPPLSWQTYDVLWKTDSTDPKTKKPIAHVTVQHNGVTIHDGLDYPASEGPIHLQNHGNPVFYRNIWVVELK
jgi:6-phosphogluconolactonase